MPFTEIKLTANGFLYGEYQYPLEVHAHKSYSEVDILRMAAPSFMFLVAGSSSSKLPYSYREKNRGCPKTK